MTYGIASKQTRSDLGPILSRHVEYAGDDSVEVDIIIDGALDESFTVRAEFAPVVVDRLHEAILAEADKCGIDSFEVAAYVPENGDIYARSWDRAYVETTMIARRPLLARILTWVRFVWVDRILRDSPTDDGNNLLPFK